jgi:hypothetical protein
MFSRQGHRLKSKFGALRVYVFGNEDSYPLPIGAIVTAVGLTLIMIAGVIEVFEWLS